jgi:hypothetical protein
MDFSSSLHNGLYIIYIDIMPLEHIFLIHEKCPGVFGDFRVFLETFGCFWRLTIHGIIYIIVIC